MAERIVRCKQGHLYTTTFSQQLFALHLGRAKYQRCPVDHKWSITVPVRRNEISDAEFEQALRNGGGVV